MRYNIGDLFVSDIGCLMYIKEYTDDVLGMRYKVQFYEPNKKEYSYTFSNSSIQCMLQENGGWLYYPVKI